MTTTDAGEPGWERLVRFEGPSNFRDLGGYRTESGHVVRRGLVYRADSLHLLTAADLEAFARLGVTHVVDLRNDQERKVHPNPIAHAVQLSLESGAARSTSGEWSFEGVENGERLLRDGYLSMLANGAPVFGRFLRTLLTPEGVPVVFHCHAGKDRTGVLAAVILRALGVDRESVLDDYELTAKYRNPADGDESMKRLIERGLAPEAALGLVGSPRWAMVDMLDALDDRHGGIDRYLTAEAGLTDDEIDVLRARLLEPA